jgi:hypothetical protein
MPDKMAENLKAVTGKEAPLEGTTVVADTAGRYKRSSPTIGTATAIRI